MPIQQEVKASQNCAILPTDIETPNGPTLLIPLVDKVPHQLRPIAELRVPAPNKTMLSALLVDVASNQPTPITQLEAPASNETMLSAPPAE